jgi:hypothetical protein
MPSANHPIWGLIERGGMVLFVGFLLWWNYNGTDQRDLKTILQLLAAVTSTGILRHSLSSPRE